MARSDIQLHRPGQQTSAVGLAAQQQGQQASEDALDGMCIASGSDVAGAKQYRWQAIWEWHKDAGLCPAITQVAFPHRQAGL